MKTHYRTIRETVVTATPVKAKPAAAAASKPPAPSRDKQHPASIEIIGDGYLVLIDAFVPMSLARQFEALIDCHNRAS